jgi:manganese/zinc/iron transport system substrate-binding protein
LANQKEYFVLLKTLIMAFAVTVMASAELTIVATTGMVADITRHVVGEHGDVSSLMGEGVDPHLYKPTASDARKIMQADMIFYSGLLLEGRMTDTFLKAARLGKVVFPVTELIEETYLLEPPEFEGHWDPHVWMDVSAWARAVDAIAEALCGQDPTNCEEYKANAKEFGETLLQLHEYAIGAIGSIPENQRILITAHDAFNYFGRAYGIEVVGIQGLSTESEAGIEDVNRLVVMLVDKKITAVFVESSVSDRNVKALIEGAKSKGHTVTIGGRLFSDAMGQGGTYEGTYIGMLDHNITTIARALGGSVPKDGFAGISSPQEEE